MPVGPMPVGGTIFASDGSTSYPDVTVTCRNITRNTKKSQVSDSTDGSYTFELSDPEFGGYADGDSFDVVARIGPFYKRETFTLNIYGEPPSVNLTLALEDKIRIMDLDLVNDELIKFFRKNLPDPNERDSMRNETQTGTGSKVSFTLAEETIKFVNYIFVNNVAQSEWVDYWVDLKDNDPGDAPVVYFLSPPADEALVEFTYTYGASWIFPDAPRVDLKLTNYPRVRIRMHPFNTREASLGANSNFTDLGGTATVWSIKTNELTGLTNDIRVLIMENKKSFHNFNPITPTTVGAPIPVPIRGNRTVEQSQGFRVLNKLEKIEN